MKKLLLSLITPAFVLIPVLAEAALGGAPERFESASTAVRKAGAGRTAVANTSARPENAAYSVRESTLSSGTVVREYVGDDGMVFAVTWKGPFQPNVRRLLGQRHFKTMTEHAKRKPGGGKSRVAIDDSEVVIRTYGHMRSYEGKAWLPARLPSGVSTADIE